MAGGPLVMGTTGAGDVKSRCNSCQGNVSKCRPDATRLFNGTCAWATQSKLPARPHGQAGAATWSTMIPGGIG